MGNKKELPDIFTAIYVLLRQQKVTKHLDPLRTMERIKWSFNIFRKIKRVSAFSFEADGLKIDFKLISC